MDTYKSFEDLRRRERENAFAVRLREGTSGVAVLAPHGGGIEPGTSEIADAVAGREHTFYAFEGLKPKGNRTLHIASTKFDEPLGLATARRARLVLTIHGCGQASEVVFVGSREVSVTQALCDCLGQAGFLAEDRPVSGLWGRHPDNLCNRGRNSFGVQLEVSRGLRVRMFGSLEPGSETVKTSLFGVFVEAVRRAIADMEPGV